MAIEIEMCVERDSTIALATSRGLGENWANALPVDYVTRWCAGTAPRDPNNSVASISPGPFEPNVDCIDSHDRQGRQAFTPGEPAEGIDVATHRAPNRLPKVLAGVGGTALGAATLAATIWPGFDAVRNLLP